MPDALASGIRVAYDDVGDDEPALLFLPGWCVNRSIFSGLARTREHRRSLSSTGEGMADRLRRKPTSARAQAQSEQPFPDSFETPDEIAEAILRFVE